MIKLKIEQKIIAVAFIVFTALQGVLIHWYIVKDSYYFLISPIICLIWLYFGIIRMMKWDANNLNNETKKV